MNSHALYSASVLRVAWAAHKFSLFLLLRKPRFFSGGGGRWLRNCIDIGGLAVRWDTGYVNRAISNGCTHVFCVDILEPDQSEAIHASSTLHLCDLRISFLVELLFSSSAESHAARSCVLESHEAHGPPPYICFCESAGPKS